MEPINQRLKAIREIFQLTQKEFAEKLNVKRSYYSELESGKRPVSAKIMRQLIDNHGVAADFLMTGKGEMFVNQQQSGSRDKTLDKAGESSLNSDTGLSGSSVGVDVGFEEKKYQLEKAARRFSEDLKVENPELSKLVTDAFSIIDFQFFIKNFTLNYLKVVLVGDSKQQGYFNNGPFNYNQYKKDRIESIKKIEQLRPVLDNLNKAIMQFYSEFAPFDDKNILEDSFPGLKAK